MVFNEPCSVDVPDSSVQRPEVPSSVELEGKSQMFRYSFLLDPKVENQKHFCLLSKNLLNSIDMKKSTEVFEQLFPVN